MKIEGLEGLKGVRKVNLGRMVVTSEALWGGETGEPVSLYRKPERQGFPASEPPKVQRFQSKSTFARPTYRCPGWRPFEEDGGKTQGHDDQIELLPSTSTSLASGMAGLPDENLIELLLHLKVCTQTFSYSRLVSKRCAVAIENHSGAGEDDPELPTSGFVRTHGLDGQD